MANNRFADCLAAMLAAHQQAAVAQVPAHAVKPRIKAKARAIRQWTAPEPAPIAVSPTEIRRRRLVRGWKGGAA